MTRLMGTRMELGEVSSCPCLVNSIKQTRKVCRKRARLLQRTINPEPDWWSLQECKHQQASL